MFPYDDEGDNPPITTSLSRGIYIHIAIAWAGKSPTNTELLHHSKNFPMISLRPKNVRGVTHSAHTMVFRAVVEIRPTETNDYTQ